MESKTERQNDILSIIGGLVVSHQRCDTKLAICPTRV